ncbi:hypothetical protein [Mucilaginibacter sp.]
MKKLSFLIIGLLALSYFACKKTATIQEQKICCGANIVPTVRATKNTTYWISQITDTLNNDSVTFYGKTDSDMLKLKFEYKSLGASATPVKNYTATYYTLKNGKVVNSYKLNTSVPDTLNVQYYKTATGQYGANSVYGYFALKFKINTYTPGTDTTAVKFHSGIFYSLLSN